MHGLTMSQALIDLPVPNSRFSIDIHVKDTIQH